MTKQEAITAMKQGYKVTHRYFSDSEWVRSGLGITYEFEDGCSCTSTQFWHDRSGVEWESDWSIYND